MPRRPPAAPRIPPLEDVIHPGLRGVPIEPNLPIALSSYDFRAYHTGSGTVVLHLKAILMIGTTTPFGFSAYLHEIAGTLSLPDLPALPLEEFWYSELMPFPFDGRIRAADFGVKVATSLNTIRQCAADLHLRFDFNIVGAPFRGVIDHPVTISPRFRRPTRRGL